MRISELLRGVNILKNTVDPVQEITGVCTDSRQVEPGNLFLAIPGYATDGYQYLGAAAAAGAVAAVCERVPDVDIPYILVKNARVAEASIAANWYGRPAGRLKLVGVTGTNGKTTVTYLLKTLLERTLDAKVGLIGTIQNMIGSEVVETSHTTPGALELQSLLWRMAQAGCSHVVMEVSSHALALHRVDGLRFETAVFTNLTEDHLDFHKTMKAYGDAKALLFRRCGARGAERGRPRME